MEKIHTQNKAFENSLVVVSAKEHGKIYQIRDGEMKALEYVEEHPPELGDNEGFFTRSAGGIQLGSGAPYEENEQHNIEQYIKGITSELSDAIKSFNPDTLFLFEPEHLKGLIEEHVMKPNDLAVANVRYGNFVEKPAGEILKMLQDSTDSKLDPADPASVEGEENAEEKRKILETGQLRDSV
jgi:hypothetical protein